MFRLGIAIGIVIGVCVGYQFSRKRQPQYKVYDEQKVEDLNDAIRERRMSK